MSKEKILIVNAIPLNNGDAALVFSLYNKLKEKGHQVKIATYYFNEVSKKYPKYSFVREIGEAYIFRKLPILKFWLFPILFYFSKPHRKADVIIGAPGGYINSNYRIKSSLSVFKSAKKHQKKTAVYAQSVGPLSEKDSSYFKNILTKYIDFLWVRDTYSLQVVKDLDVPNEKYKLTKDFAFVIKDIVIKKYSTKKVAFSVREWQYDHRNKKQYISLIVSLVNTLTDNGYEVIFLSTCQGEPTYKDDAVLATEIYRQLTDKTHVSVDKNYYVLPKFIDRLNDFDFVMGTRLHMCILAMTQLIPAFNISYEVKGKETYKYLDMEKYSIDYNDKIETSITSLQDFIEHFSEIKTDLKSKIPAIRKEVMDDFEYFYEKVLIN
jgi:polysaccharide pyruvyl transferase WcaK-like protein